MKVEFQCYPPSQECESCQIDGEFTGNCIELSRIVTGNVNLDVLMIITVIPRFWKVILQLLYCNISP